MGRESSCCVPRQAARRLRAARIALRRAASSLGSCAIRREVEADRDDARGEGDDVLVAVPLEGVALAVEVPAVDLDDHALLREVDVPLAAIGEEVVDDRFGKVVGGAEGQEVVLEPGGRGVGVGRGVGCEARGAGVTAGAGEDPTEVATAEQLAAERLVDGPA